MSDKETPTAGVGRGPQGRLRALVAEWRENSIRSRANADNEKIPTLDRRQCFGVSQAYEQCADELADALAALDASRPEMECDQCGAKPGTWGPEWAGWVADHGDGSRCPMDKIKGCDGTMQASPAEEIAIVREVLNADLKLASDRVLTLELENQWLRAALDASRPHQCECAICRVMNGTGEQK